MTNVNEAPTGLLLSVPSTVFENFSPLFPNTLSKIGYSSLRLVCVVVFRAVRSWAAVVRRDARCRPLAPPLVPVHSGPYSAYLPTAPTCKLAWHLARSLWWKP